MSRETKFWWLVAVIFSVCSRELMAQPWSSWDSWSTASNSWTDWSSWGSWSTMPSSWNDWSSWSNGWSSWNDWSSWSSGWSSWAQQASNDVVDTAGGSARAQYILQNSANITKLNAKCDELIAENLNNHSDAKNTQPLVPTDLNMKFILINLNDIDDAAGILSITARIDFRWYDSRLALPANGSCDGQSLLVKTSDLWFPYFIIQNGANDVFYPDAWEKFPSTLRYDGYIDWRVAFKLDLSCDMDFTIFPFDNQYCKILIQSPHYGEGELNYTVVDRTRGIVVFDSDSADHPMWEIRGQAVKFTSKVPGVVFWISLRRKFIYYIWTIAIPVLAVCVLTASTFVIPAHGEEKMSTVISGLLSFFLLYLMFVNAIPQTSTNIPLLMVFFSVQILLTTIQVVMCGAILRLLGLEEAEEEMEKQALEDEEEDGNSPRRRLDSNASGQHERRNHAQFLYGPSSGNHGHIPIHANAIAPIAEDVNVDLEHSSTDLIPAKKSPIGNKRRFITSAWLNEITLAVYLITVVITIVGFVGAMVQVYKASAPELTYNPIEEYRIGE